MSPISDSLDLQHLGLKPGGGTRFETLVRIGGFVFGGQRYEPAPDPLPVLVDAGRTSSGFVVRVRAKPRIKGPCMRCSDDFALELKIDQSEVHEPTLGDEAASDYVTGHELDLASFVRDAIGLTLPSSISGPLGEDGGCAACGRSRRNLAEMGVLDESAAAEQGDDDGSREPDPRWAKLRELEL